MHVTAEGAEALKPYWALAVSPWGVSSLSESRELQTSDLSWLVGVAVSRTLIYGRLAE